MIFKQQLTHISKVLNSTGNTTQLLTSFNALDAAQQKVILSSSLLTEKQKEQCATMVALSSTNTKYTAEQIAKTAGISSETLANWGLVESTDSLTLSELAEIVASDAQAKTALEKIIAQNAEAVANGEVTTSTIALATSEAGATLATGAFTTAIKANVRAMWTWLTTTPLGWLTLLAAGVYAAVKAYDALTVSVEEQKEKVEESASAYKEAKSELDSITTELEKQEQAMDDLLAKEKLTYAEKGQLEELQAITRELRIQKDLAEKEENRTERQLAKDASDLFNKQFGSYDISESAINNYRNNASITRNNAILVSDENNISSMIAGYKQFNELLDEAYGTGSQEDIDHFTSLTEYLKESIFATAQDLQAQQGNIADYYNSIKDVAYEDLTTEQKEIVDSYNAISDAIELIYQQLDPNTWKTIQIDNVFDTDGLEVTKKELIALAKSGKLDEETILSYSKLSNALEQNNVSARELLDELQALADSENDFGSDFDDGVLDLSKWFESNKDSIDDFQSKLKTLGDALSSIQSGDFEDSDLTDLLQEFPELADKTDDLETAIVELINNALQALYDTLGEDIPDSLKTSLQDLADIASGTAKHLGDAFSDIHDSWDILHDFKETMDKGFDSNVTDSLLQSVRGLSGELETLVAGYYSGVVSAEQLYEALTQHYENDLHNYSEALIKKNELNEDFYNAVGLASEEVTNQFWDDYKVDIDNCKTYNQTKLEIEKQTLGKISAMWSQYYDAQSQTLKLSMSEIEARATHGGGDAKAFLEQYELIENYEAAIEALNNITYDGIRSNFEGIGSKLSANSESSSTEKDFEETFDWIETAIDRIERSVSNLDLKASSVYRSWSERNASLKAELLDVKKEMDIQASGYNKYMQQAASVGLSEEWASKVRNGQIDISSITNESLAKRIKEYQDWYRNMPLYLVTGGGILFNC